MQCTSENHIVSVKSFNSRNPSRIIQKSKNFLGFAICDVSNNISIGLATNKVCVKVSHKITNRKKINQSINFILFLSKSAYIEINNTAVDKKRRRWQNDIR